MRWSATRLRWVLLGGVFLLAAVVAGFFGLARYRAGKVWQRILARNGVNLRHESNGVTWSQSSKGRTIFTVHASKAVPQGNNKYALHDAVLILYGREPGRDDRIYGREFEYDQEQGIARALGEVHMDLQGPEPGGKAPAAGSRPDLGFGPEDPAAADPAVIHVRTSGLVYMRKLGIAATGEETEFRYRGITCTSHGAEFDSEHSRVRLLADVRMSGQLQRAPFTLTASHAELDRTDETADLTAPVLSSGLRGARAAHAVFHLHKDGTLQSAEASGAVELRSGTQTVAAPQLTSVFGTQNQPESMRLFTGVTFTNADRAKPGHGTASTMDLAWDAQGNLNQMTAAGAVRYTGSQVGQNGGTEQRRMQAERAEASFTSNVARHPALRRVHLIGGAEVDAANHSADPAARDTETRVLADDLTTEFAAGARGRVSARTLEGTGHTRLDQMSADGARQQSTGETLQVSFAPRADAANSGQVLLTEAVQMGQVTVENWAAPKAGSTVDQHPDHTTGRAGKAVYVAGAGTLTLTGAGSERATVEQAQGQLAAAQIVLHQGTGDAEASGEVAATDVPANGGPATHILASRAHLLHAANLSEFYGNAERSAQLWQGGSQIQAAVITLDDKSHALSARPAETDNRVHAVFATGAKREPANPKPGVAPSQKAAAALGRTGGSGVLGESLPEAERDAVQVTAGRLDYDETHHEAVFAGGVRLSGTMGEVLAERGVAFLKAPAEKPTGAAKRDPKADTISPGAGPDLSGSLDRMVMLGAVRLTQPGRTGTGEQLTYTADTGSFALTGSSGKPPRVVGEQGSVVTGTTLLFNSAESTIVVAGTKSGSKAAGTTRVHTETDLKQ